MSKQCISRKIQCQIKNLQKKMLFHCGLHLFRYTTFACNGLNYVENRPCRAFSAC